MCGTRRDFDPKPQNFLFEHSKGRIGRVIAFPVAGDLGQPVFEGDFAYKIDQFE
jgi:hypothetical protein